MFEKWNKISQLPHKYFCRAKIRGTAPGEIHVGEALLKQMLQMRAEIDR